MGTRVQQTGGGGGGGGPYLQLADKSGVTALLEDLKRLLEDRDTADVVFLLGGEESPVYAHRVILAARCSAFQNTKRGEVCRISGCTSLVGSPSSPAQIRLPHYSETSFRKFLLYVYTGKLLLQDSAVFEMLGAAQELGLEELRLSCEDHVTSTLDVSNACTFLAAALEMHERSVPHAGHIVGFDEYMNLVMDDSEEVHLKTKNRKTLGRIMLKGDNITLIQIVNPPS